jgi:tetratricopeptide (TPR) repeat protein
VGAAALGSCAISFRSIHLDQAERIRVGEILYRPLRRALGATGFGVNAYTGENAGDPLIEPHDETSPGSGGHEELYFVATGHAAFEIAGERRDAPAGTLILVPPGVRREAVAEVVDTTVLVVGGKPGAALPVSPFEHWYAAQAAYDAGDYERAVAIASEGLVDWPDHGQLHYQLACFESLAGHPAEALDHLHAAADADPRVVEWAQDDTDLDAIRGEPGFPARD